MTDEEILQAARELIPLLRELLADEAPKVESELRRCLEDAPTVGAKASADRILEVIASHPATRAWLRARASIDEEGRKSMTRGGEAPPAQRMYDVVQIHFATDRRASGDSAPSRFFIGHRDPEERITYGTCDVSIPANHKKGELEGPSWKRLEFWQDPARHVVLLKVQTLGADAFFSSAAAGGPQGLVFVHGFNVTFEDAARRMAQIARDLKFDGVPLLYSWPSRGGMAAYPVDEATVEWTIPHLRQFFLDLTAKTTIPTFHVIGHSMGNRAVTRVLQSLAKEPSIRARFHQVVLTAPDIDAEVFKQIIPDVVAAARKVTLYASADDVALLASRRFHGFRRAGDAAGSVIVMDGLDSVDATGVDTSFLSHSYFGEVRTVLSDVYYLLRGVPAKDRSDLEVMTSSSGTYFRFVR